MNMTEIALTFQTEKVRAGGLFIFYLTKGKKLLYRVSDFTLTSHVMYFGDKVTWHS